MKLNNISTGILIVCILCGIVTAATTISDTSISVDNLILGGQTIVAYTTALNTKLSGIETLADVTDTTNVNDAGALMESDISDQSFTNLLENGDLESWSGGVAVAPDGWITSGAAPTIAKELTIIQTGLASMNLTAVHTNSAMVGSTNEYIHYRSRIVTAGCWIHSTHTGAKLYIVDGSGFYDTAHSGNGGWEFITKTITVDASASCLEVHVTPDNVNGTGFAYFDSAILVEGSVCPAFSSKPLVNDGIMLQSHTPSSASDYGVGGQWCYDDDYIYVCNATDTWIRTSLTTW